MNFINKGVLPLAIGAGVGYMAHMAGVEDIGLLEGMKQTALTLLPIYAGVYAISNGVSQEEVDSFFDKLGSGRIPISIIMEAGLYVGGSYIAEKITGQPINHIIVG